VFWKDVLAPNSLLQNIVNLLKIIGNQEKP